MGITLTCDYTDIGILTSCFHIQLENFIIICYNGDSLDVQKITTWIKVNTYLGGGGKK